MFAQMKYLRITTLGITIVLVACGLIACGGGSTPAASTSSAAGSFATSVTLGDAPSDDVVSYEMTITSLQLDGQEMLSGSRRLELTHLSATVEHLSMASIAPGTHTATIQWSSPHVTFMDDKGLLHEVPSTASGTVTITGVTVGAGASVLNFDLDVDKSVTVDTVAGNATFAGTPAFSFTSSRSMGETEREAETGEIEDMAGKVTAASSSSVTIDSFPKPFTVNASTKLDGITAVDSTLVGRIVTIEGTIQTDGSIVAKEIEAESADGNGAEAEGLVTSVDPLLSTFTMIVQDKSGTSLSNDDLGKTITVNATNAKFSIGKTKINVPSTFAFASINNLRPGQRVEVDSDTPKSAGTGTVDNDGSMDAAGVKKVKLQQQAVRGTIQALTANGFTLSVTLPSGIVTKAIAAGITNCSATTNTCSLDVVTNSSTQLKNGVTVTATGNPLVRVRGLLFGDVNGYHLVAGRITTP